MCKHCLCPSVCLSVTQRYTTKAKRADEIVAYQGVDNWMHRQSSPQGLHYSEPETAWRRRTDSPVEGGMNETGVTDVIQV